MKTITPTHFSKSLEGIQMFKEDIEEIISRIQSKDFEIEISDGNVLYDSIEELCSYKGSSVKSFTITAITEPEKDWQRERISFSFQNNSVRISSIGSEKMYSTGFEFVDFFRSKVPWHYTFFNPTYIFIPIFTMLIPLTSTYVKYGHTLLHQFFVVLYMLLILFLIVSYTLRLTFYGVYLTRKHEHGFWKRNKDNILLAIIGAVGGSMLTLLIQWLQSNQ